MYDDLSSYVKIIYHDIYISTPLWREDNIVNGYNLYDTTDYVISVTYNADEEYTDIVDYYIYGYSFVYDGVTITVGTSIVEPEVIDAQKDTMKDIIDRMVKTIRTEL